MKSHQAAALGMLLIAFLYLYFVFDYQDVQKTETVRECVEQAKRDIEWDKTMPAVMIKGRLYYDTGTESPFMRHCVWHGVITSAVDSSQMPTEENQSNFGTDFGYCYITDDAVDLFINEKWIIFACRDEEYRNTITTD